MNVNLYYFQCRTEGILSTAKSTLKKKTKKGFQHITLMQALRSIKSWFTLILKRDLLGEIMLKCMQF